MSRSRSGSFALSGSGSGSGSVCGARRAALIPCALACLAGLSGCGPTEATPAVAGARAALTAEPVRLLYAKAYNYGCSSCMTWGGVIEVENLAYDKQVTVAYQGLGGGAAGEAPASYLRTLPSGRELWTFGSTGGNGTSQLRVRYRAAGRELWDSNGGWDYWGRIESATGVGLVGVESPLGLGIDVVVTEASVSLPARGRPNTELWAQILVRNRAYEKQVRLVSSTDGWRTVRAADAAYQYGDGAGGELWTARQIVDSDATEISFAVSAQQGGSEAWDNNFGQNFTCRSDPALGGWRCTGEAFVICTGLSGCHG